MARHLLNTSSTPCYLSSFLSLFLIAIPIAPRYICGSIENAPTSLIASRHLVDRSSFCSWIWFLLLDTLAVDKHFLNTYLDSFLDTSRYFICQALLKVLFKPPHAIQFSFHSISLSIALCFLSQTLSSHSNLNPQRFLRDFSRFSSLGKLLISHSSCISCFET